LKGKNDVFQFSESARDIGLLAGACDWLYVGASVRDSWLAGPLIPYAILAVVLAAGWTFWPRPAPEVGQSVALPPANEVRTVEKIIERPKIVYVYPQKTKQALNLPQDVVADPAKKAIATGKLDAEEREYSLTAVLDTETGDSHVYARPEPLPWIGPGKRGAVGMAYGMKNGNQVGMIYAEHDLLRVKALHAGARAQAFSDGDWFAGWYVEIRW
jgi:hypothetical protein